MVQTPAVGQIDSEVLVHSVLLLDVFRKVRFSLNFSKRPKLWLLSFLNVQIRCIKVVLVLLLVFTFKGFMSKEKMKQSRVLKTSLIKQEAAVE